MFRRNIFVFIKLRRKQICWTWKLDPLFAIFYLYRWLLQKIIIDTQMGDPISHILADLVIDAILKKNLRNINFAFSFLIIPSNSTDYVFEQFNIWNYKLKFFIQYSINFINCNNNYNVVTTLPYTMHVIIMITNKYK